jgi:hypothetical protein
MVFSTVNVVVVMMLRVAHVGCGMYFFSKKPFAARSMARSSAFNCSLAHLLVSSLRASRIYKKLHDYLPAQPERHSL